MNKETKTSSLASDHIIILGCGLSGMLTALAFAHQGLKVKIIESKSTRDVKFLDDNRTTAFTVASQEFMSKINIWPSLQEIAGKISDIYVVDDKSPNDIHFSSHQVNNDVMGYIVKNSKFKKILLSKVIDNNLITLMDNCTYRKFESFPDYFIVYLEDNKKLQCQLLIICEGYNSRVRVAYFGEYIQKSYEQKALTFNVTHELSHNETAIEHFTDTGPFAILPLRDAYMSSVVWTLTTEKANILQKLPILEFQYLVQQNFGTFLGNIKIETKVTAHQLRAYLTQNYFHQRIVLVADSAHIIHPLAGQGLNMGIKDIDTLVALVENIGINSKMLNEYQQQRKSDNLHMYLITDTLNRIFNNRSFLMNIVRKTGFFFIEKLLPIKNRLIKYAMGERRI